MTSPACAGLIAIAALAMVAPAVAHAQPDAKRGEYLSKAAGCKGCHTEAREGATPYAGGRALRTPFGTFYGPNITPHPSAGIGRWSEADFLRALREGRRPGGGHYFPAFPYPSFTQITDADARDLWAYFRTLPPDAAENRAHVLPAMIGSSEFRIPDLVRWTVALWNRLHFRPGPFVADAARSPELNRGNYLVNALGHCGECHTPRGWLGGLDRSRHLAGAALAEGGGAPNLTPTRLKKWDDAELKDFLAYGLTPDGDVAGEAMGEVIRNTTSQLSPSDLAAMVAYLRALPALPESGP